MASLARSARALRAVKVQAPVVQVRALSSTSAKKAEGEPAVAPTINSPFKAPTKAQTTKIPSFAAYRSKKNNAGKNLLFQYFMVGSMGALTAAGAKATVQGMTIMHKGYVIGLEGQLVAGGCGWHRWANIGTL
jgi:ubiquinol-cytochrome c reductase iron-sulfur subunit